MPQECSHISACIQALSLILAFAFVGREILGLLQYFTSGGSMRTLLGK